MAGGCGRHGQQQGLQEERVCAGETLQFSAVPDIDTHLTHSAGANYIQVEEGCSRSTASPPMLGNSARRLGSPSWPSLAGRPSLQCVAPGPDGAPTVPPRSQSDGTRAEPTRGGGCLQEKDDEKAAWAAAGDRLRRCVSRPLYP